MHGPVLRVTRLFWVLAGAMILMWALGIPSSRSPVVGKFILLRLYVWDPSLLSPAVTQKLLSVLRGNPGFFATCPHRQFTREMHPFFPAKRKMSLWFSILLHSTHYVRSALILCIWWIQKGPTIISAKSFLPHKVTSSRRWYDIIFTSPFYTKGKGITQRYGL